MRDLLGSLLGSVSVQPPAGQEQLTILAQTHPLLVPLLPAALATLSLIRLATGQAMADTTTVEVSPPICPYLCHFFDGSRGKFGMHLPMR